MSRKRTVMHDHSNFVAETYGVVETQSLAEWLVSWKQYLSHLGPLTGKRVLDIGGGAGPLACCMAHLGAHVTLLEISQANIAYARKTCASHLTPEELSRITFVVGDVLEMPTPTIYYDVVTMTDVWEHLTPELAERILWRIFGLVHTHSTILISTSPNKFLANLLRPIWVLCFGKKGGLKDQGIHINEQTARSFTTALNVSNAFPFDMYPTYFDGWLNGELENMVRVRGAYAKLRPVVRLAARVMDVIYWRSPNWVKLLVSRGLVGVANSRRI